MTNVSKLRRQEFQLTLVVLVLAMFSLGLFGIGKRDKSKQSLSPESKVQEAATEQAVSKADLVQPVKASKKIDLAVPLEVTGQTSEESQKIEKIRAELQAIVDRTRQLQVKVREDRAEIQQIIDRARIHEQILRNMTLTKPVLTKPQVNTEQILRREKVRLITEQAQRMKDQVATLERTRALTQVRNVLPQRANVQRPVSVKTQKTETNP